MMMMSVYCNLLIMNSKLVVLPVQKREARVVEKWKKIGRGALVRERVQNTYSLEFAN